MVALSPLDLKNNDYLTELGIKNKVQKENKNQNYINISKENQSSREENSKSDNEAIQNVSSNINTSYRALTN